MSLPRWAAWLLLALCGPASGGQARDRLAEAVGCDLDQAAAVAGALLSVPHPAVAAAAGVWRRGGTSTGGLGRWLAGLPPAVETGELTGQAALDDWAQRSTSGMIREFPVDLSSEVLLVLTSALAARVSWEEPFDAVPGAALGPHSRWASQLRAVLRTPQGGGVSTRRGWSHGQFIAATGQAGDVAVHTAWGSWRAPGDLGSRPARRSGRRRPRRRLPAGECHRQRRPVARRSLFDLPLGSAPLWEIIERPAPVEALDGRKEECTAVLPAWSAASVRRGAG